MICPHCGEELIRKTGASGSNVLDSRPCAGGIRRRRQCPRCGNRFTTIEEVIPPGAAGPGRKAIGSAGMRDEAGRRIGALADEVEALALRLRRFVADGLDEVGYADAALNL